jgi:hypothetical protein
VVFEPLVDPRHKLLCTDNAAVREVPGPVSKAIHAVKFQACRACPMESILVSYSIGVQFTCDSLAYFTGAFGPVFLLLYQSTFFHRQIACKRLGVPLRFCGQMLLVQNRLKETGPGYGSAHDTRGNTSGMPQVSPRSRAAFVPGGEWFPIHPVK